MYKISYCCNVVLLVSRKSNASSSKLSLPVGRSILTTSKSLYVLPNSSKFSKRQYNTDPDYGKFATPRRIDSFYEWFTSTSWIQSIEKTLVSFHDLTGLPWWTIIVMSTVLLRLTVMTPLYIKQVKYNIKYQMFLPIFSQVYQKLSKEVDEEAKIQKWDEKMIQKQFVSNLYRHRKALYKKYNVPGIGKRFFLPMVQIPLWISLSISLRHMSYNLPLYNTLTLEQQSVLLQLSQEGCLWFTNLCVNDAFFIMPVLLGVVNLSIIEIYRGDAKTKLVGLTKFWINTARILSVLLIPIACQMPTAVVLYWFSSSLYGASQAFTFRSHKIKRFFHIPIATNESKTPYKDIFKRLSFFKNYQFKNQSKL